MTKVDMSDWVFPIREKFNLTENFLDQYTNEQPNWGPVGAITYKRTYSRYIEKEDRYEEFWETLKRVVEGCYTIQLNHCKNLRLYWNAHKAQKSAQKMFELMWNFKFLPPGRMLWTLGEDVVWKKGVAVLLNCGFCSTEDLHYDFSGPFCWLMDVALLGVGCGFDLKGAGKVKIQEPKVGDYVFTIDDSREGWRDAVEVVLNSYVHKSKMPREFDFSKIRPNGSFIKTFGGIAPGPGPLKLCIEEIKLVLNKCVDKYITSVNIVDIFNIVGKCVVSGGQRRSSEIAIGEYDDIDFLNMKNPEKYEKELKDWRWNSNNSVFAEVGADYTQLTKHIINNGEPGIVYLDNMRKYGRIKDGEKWEDEGVCGLNPCAEMSLSKYEMCLLCETFPANHENEEEFLETLKYAYLLAKSVTLVPSHDERTNQVMLRNRRIGLSMSGITDAIYKFGRRRFLNEFCDSGYNNIRKLDKLYSRWLCVPKSIKVTTTKPSGCRPGRSLTSTDRGILSLDELLEEHPEDLEWNNDHSDSYVYQKNSKNKILRTYRNSTSKIIKIKMNYNLDFECTPNHMVFVSEHMNASSEKGGYKRIDVNKWICANDVRAGDIIHISMNSYRKNICSKLSHSAIPDTFIGARGNIITQPEYMNNDLAWIIGYLYGDGCLSRHKFRTRFIDENKYNLEKAKKIIYDLFGLDSNIKPASQDRNAFVLEIGSRHLWDFWNINGITKYDEQGNISVIPRIVRESSKENILAFISGLIDSDGCVFVRDGDVGICISTAYDNFAKNIQEVGFSVGLCFGRSLNTEGENKQEIKHIWNLTLNSHTDINSLHVLLKTSNKLIKINDMRNPPHDISFKCLTESQNVLILGKVVSVHELEGYEETYDLEVDKDHWYYSGGIKSHNTVSLLPGSNPGIHFPHSEYYIRRIEFQKNSPFIKPLEIAGYKKEQSYYKKNSWIFEFPIRTKNFFKSKRDITIWEQMALHADIQHYWSDNGVSQTVTFNENESNSIKDVLEVYEDKIKAVSFLPLDVKSYKQMPYEEITKEKYELYISTLKPLKLSKIKMTKEEEIESKETLKFCDNGSCEIKK